MTAPQFTTLHVAVDGPRGELILARPEKLNAMTLTMLEELVTAAHWFDTHHQLKVVVVGGRGRAFTSGADVDLVVGRTDVPDPHHAADAGRRAADAIAAMRAVTVARIQGHCVGGGVVLAAACDLRIATEDAVFVIPEVDLGIPLGWGGMPRLVREIGLARAKELVMTCRPFGASEAQRAGFLNRVVPPAELDDAVAAMVSLLEAKPRMALLGVKANANAVADSMASTARSWAEADGLLAARHDDEGQAAAARYLEAMRRPLAGER